jgi:hypothetical protein
MNQSELDEIREELTLRRMEKRNRRMIDERNSCLIRFSNNPFAQIVVTLLFVWIFVRLVA